MAFKIKKKYALNKKIKKYMQKDKKNGSFQLHKPQILN